VRFCNTTVKIDSLCELHHIRYLCAIYMGCAFAYRLHCAISIVLGRTHDNDFIKSQFPTEKIKKNVNKKLSISYKQVVFFNASVTMLAGGFLAFFGIINTPIEIVIEDPNSYREILTTEVDADSSGNGS